MRSEDVHDLKQLGAAQTLAAAQAHVKGMHFCDLTGNGQLCVPWHIRVGGLITAVVEAMHTPQITPLGDIEGHHDRPVHQPVMIQVDKHFMLWQG